MSKRKTMTPSGLMICKGCNEAKKLRAKQLCVSCWNKFCDWYRTGKVSKTGSRSNIRKNGKNRPTSATPNDIDEWREAVQKEETRTSSHNHSSSTDNKKDLVPKPTLNLNRLSSFMESDSSTVNMLAHLCDIIHMTSEAGENIELDGFRIGESSTIDRISLEHLLEQMCDFGVLQHNDNAWMVVSEDLATELAIRLRGGDDNAVASVLPQSEAMGAQEISTANEHQTLESDLSLTADTPLLEPDTQSSSIPPPNPQVESNPLPVLTEICSTCSQKGLPPATVHRHGLCHDCYISFMTWWDRAGFVGRVFNPERRIAEWMGKVEQRYFPTPEDNFHTHDDINDHGFPAITHLLQALNHPSLEQLREEIRRLSNTYSANVSKFEKFRQRENEAKQRAQENQEKLDSANAKIQYLEGEIEKLNLVKVAIEDEANALRDQLNLIEQALKGRR